MIGTSFCLCQAHQGNDGNFANIIGDDANGDIDDDADGHTGIVICCCIFSPEILNSPVELGIGLQ